MKLIEGYEEGTLKQIMDVEQIQDLIPHRYPFLLIDKIVQLEPGRSARGIKNVTRNEWFFDGHFPGFPLMPGVLIIEALAQVGVVAMMSVPQNKNLLVLFAGMDKVRFKRQVVPGDQLELVVNIEQLRAKFGKARAEATVGTETVASAELVFMLVESQLKS